MARGCIASVVLRLPEVRQAPGDGEKAHRGRIETQRWDILAFAGSPLQCGTARGTVSFLPGGALHPGQDRPGPRRWRGRPNCVSCDSRECDFLP